MTRASVNITERARERWLLRMRDPDYQPPRYELKLEKAPGSKELILGKWMEVNND